MAEVELERHRMQQRKKGVVPGPSGSFYRNRGTHREELSLGHKQINQQTASA